MTIIRGGGVNNYQQDQIDYDSYNPRLKDSLYNHNNQNENLTPEKNERSFEIVNRVSEYDSILKRNRESLRDQPTEFGSKKYIYCAKR